MTDFPCELMLCAPVGTFGLWSMVMLSGFKFELKKGQLDIVLK